MAKKAKEENREPAPRFQFFMVDAITGVQIGGATHDVDKFTKTDLMKMVKAFKQGVAREEDFIKQRAELAEKRLNEDDEPNISSDSETRGKRVRSSRKVPKP